MYEYNGNILALYGQIDFKFIDNLGYNVVAIETHFQRSFGLLTPFSYQNHLRILVA